MIIANDTVEVTVLGPVMTKATGIGAFGVDAVMAHSGEQYILAFSHIKGKIREAWQEFGAVGHEVPIFEWLGRQQGNRAETETSFDPARGRIQFADLTHPRRTDPETLFRIRISAENGAADDGALMFVEAPFRSGEAAVFRGNIRFFAQHEEELKLMRRATAAALNWMPAVGAEQTVGFGRVDGALLREGTATPVRERAKPPGGKRWRLELKFDEPFCVTQKPSSRNLFESETIIPGAVLRGAVKELIDKAGGFAALRRQFHQIRIGHAFPMTVGGKRPRHCPLSFFTLDGTLRDAAPLEACPTVGVDPLAFRVDWKDAYVSKVDEALGWPGLERELRVRTAIRGEERRAQDEELFAYRMIVPKPEVVWRTVIDVSSVAEADVEDVKTQLAAALEAGIYFIGKTKAHASVTVSEEELVAADVAGGCALTLQTAALLLNPAAITDWQSSEQLLNAYAAAWADILPGARLVRTFQRTELLGGDYLYHRFQKKLPGQVYRPYLVTQPGSVFVFDAATVQAEAIAELVQRGLAVPKATLDFYLGGAAVEEERLWDYCPYIRENGYGEVALNVAIPEVA